MKAKLTISSTYPLLALGVAVMMSLVSVAQSPLQQRGEAIAAQRCRACHATGREGRSPQRIAPPFRELDDAFPIEMLVQSLKTGVVGGHDEMPMFDLGPEDTRALLAHIDSLASPTKRYLDPPR